MNFLRFCAAVLLLLVLAACNLSVTPTKTTVPTRDITIDYAKNYVAGEVIVGYKNHDDLTSIVDSLNATVITDWRHINAAHLQLPDSLSVEKAVAALERSKNVRYAQPNKVAFLDPLETGSDITPQVIDDPQFGNQWQHRQMNTEAAWDMGVTGKGIRIGIHDDYPDIRHPDLFPNFDPEIPGFDGFNGTLIVANTPHDGISSHGSSTAGSALAAANDIGGRGVAYEATFVPLNIADPESGGLSSAAIISAAIFAVNGPDGLSPYFDDGDTDSAPGRAAYVDVVNMSWGGLAYDQPGKDVMDYMLYHGITLVTSAGNTPTVGPSDPSWQPGLITVAATTPNGNRTTFSNRGKHVDVAAPGQYVWVTTTRDCTYETPDGSSCTADDQDYTYISGTSFSSPFTAGVAALVLEASADKDADGNITGVNLTPGQVRQILEQTAYQPDGGVFNEDLGYGIVDAGAAVEMAMDEDTWPGAGASLLVFAEANDGTRLSNVGLSLISLDDNTRATKYAQTTDSSVLQNPLGNFSWATGLGMFQEMSPGSYLLLASGPHTATTGIPAGATSQVVYLEPGDFQLITVTLDVDLFEDTYEPNNTVAEATALNAGVTTIASLGEADDVDVYSLDVTAGETYWLNIDSVAGNQDTIMTVYAADGTTELASNDDNREGAGGDSAILFDATTTETVYISITDVEGNGSPSNIYELDISTLQGSETEPNGTASLNCNITSPDFTGANTLAVGSTITGEVATETDVDIFEITLDADTTYYADLETAVNLVPDTYLTIFADENTIVASNDDYDAQDSRASFTVDTAGTYYAAVSNCNDGDQSSTGPYIFSLTTYQAPPAPTPTE